MSSITNNVRLLNTLQLIKGWLFISVTAYLLYMILKSNTIRIENAEAKSHRQEILQTEFIKNISHELRTPMNAIIGFSELAISLKDKNSEIKDYLEIIDRSSKQLLTIVTDVVDTSLLASGNIIINPNPLKVLPFLKSIYNSYLPMMKENIKLQLDFDEGKATDLLITTDEEKLRRIFNTLLNNAIKYTHKGTIKLGLKPEKDQITFFVEDTGTGIKPELQKSIFRKIKQFREGDMTNRSGGIGLGLSICKEMIKLLGGKMWFESQPGRGSKFFFSLPATQK